MTKIVSFFEKIHFFRLRMLTSPQGLVMAEKIVNKAAVCKIINLSQRPYQKIVNAVKVVSCKKLF